MKNKEKYDNIFVGDKIMKKTKTYVYTPSENVKKKMIEYYDGLRKDKNPPYSVFQANDADTTITLYEKGKIMFQGPNCDMDFDMWAAVELKNNKRDIYKDIDLKDKKTKDKKESLKDSNESYAYLKHISTIGSDEVGTGDYFGPIIVTATYVPKDKIEFLKELKIGDSKKISDERIMELGPILGENLIYASQVITNKDYNKIPDVNINKIKAALHNKVLYKLSHNENISYDKIVIDQFVNERKYYEYLAGMQNVERNILFITKAEDKVYSVAAASIISRYLFLTSIYKIEKELGKVIPLGASSTVDEFAKEMVLKHGIEVLDLYTKKNFKNTKNVLGENI